MSSRTEVESGLGQGHVFVDDLEPAEVPIWRESLVGLDWMRLRASSVYYGIGVPKGNGAAVIVVPGFMGTDTYLIELNRWLKRIGYTPYMSRIGHNADCPNVLLEHLLATTQKAFKETGRKVHLVGHSLGGVFSRNLAVHHPDLVQSVASLGSPIRGVRVHPWVLSMSGQVRDRIHRKSPKKPRELRPKSADCYTADCACGFTCTWRGEFTSDVDQLVIYTKTDGIVDWEMTRTGNPEWDVEVSGTHCGLAWNPEVYRALARHLHVSERIRSASKRLAS